MTNLPSDLHKHLDQLGSFLGAGQNQGQVWYHEFLQSENFNFSFGAAFSKYFASLFFNVNYWQNFHGWTSDSSHFRESEAQCTYIVFSEKT